MTILLSILAMAVNLLIIFYVIKKATKADEQVELLKKILAASSKPEEKSPIKMLSEERASRGL